MSCKNGLTDVSIRSTSFFVMKVSRAMTSPAVPCARNKIQTLPPTVARHALELHRLVERAARDYISSCRSTVCRYELFYFLLHHSKLSLDEQRWNGTFFEKCDLRDLGLVIQLGYAQGVCCPAPLPALRSLIVIHTNGLHPVNVQFCQCSQAHIAGSRIDQMLRRQLFPATLTEPSTVATFELLHTFHVITLQSKITAYDFYMSLEKFTDNTGLGVSYVSAIANIRVVV